MNDVAAALARYGLAPDARARLTRYGDLLLEANRRVNLTAAKDADAIAEQIADALPLVPLIRANAELIDIGAGGGLPGIPLAILCGIRVTLVDSTAKKVTFLNDVMHELELNGQAISARAENLARAAEFRERFTHATARALGTAPTVVELTLPFVALEGTALLQRGKMDDNERNAARDTALVLGGEVSDELPAGGDRRILIVTKRSPTPGRFPRRVGVAQRRPLCST